MLMLFPASKAYTRSVRLLASALCGAALLFTSSQALAEQSTQPSSSPEQMTLNVYYNFPSDTFEKYLDVFRESHPNIIVKTFRQPGAALFATVGLALGGGEVTADVIIGAAHNFYTLAQNHDHPFRRLSVTNYVKDTNNLVNGIYKANMLFLPTVIQPYGIAYNTNIVPKKKAPESFTDLLKPIWNYQLAVADPNSSTSVWGYIWFNAIKLADKGDPYGWEYFRQLGKLHPKLVNSHGTIRTLLAAGERAAGPQTMDVYLAGQERGSPTTWVWPEEGSPTMLFGWGTFKESPHPRATNIFLNWVLSKESQQALADIVGLVPVRTDVKFPWPGNVDPSTLELVPVDGKFISQNAQMIQENFNKAVSD